MTTAATLCPGLETLARYVLGQLPGDEAAGVRGHVAGCPKCAATFGSATPPPVSSAIDLVPADPAPNFPTMPLRPGGGAPLPTMAAVADPQATMPGWEPAPTFDAPPGYGPDPLLAPRPVVGSAKYPFLRPARGAGELGRLGPYRVLKLLGEGGMGMVFQAEDTGLGRPVALKVVKPEFAAEGKARLRFTREAKAVGALDHENIVTVYQVGEDHGTPYMAMQFLKGQTLDARLRMERRLPTPDVLRIGREIALGLSAAHAAGVIHRDIKPANIWLDADRGRVKILDFGLARAGEDGKLTRTGTVVGTPAYMSPEQAFGRPLTPRSDLFSLGSVLYDMTCGRAPFDAPDELAMLVAVTTQRPRPVTELNPHAPELLVRLILKLMQKHPDDRPETAAQVADLLAALGRQPPPTPAVPVKPPAGWGGTARAALLAAAVGGVAFAGFTYKDKLARAAGLPALRR